MRRYTSIPCCGECMHFRSDAVVTIGNCALAKSIQRCDDNCSLTYDNLTEAQALTILHHYQKWRRGAKSDMPHPYHVGIALDVAIKVLRDRGREK